MNANTPGSGDWDALIATFYSPPNSLQLSATEGPLAPLIEAARDAYTTRDGRPCLLPAAMDGRNYCYVCLTDASEAASLVGLVRSHLGSWVSIGPVIGPADTLGEQDMRALDFVGTAGRVVRLAMAEGTGASVATANGLRRLSRALSERPRRRAALERPIGGALGDYWDACAEHSETRALALLQSLLVDHRLSRTNGLFLRLQFLTTFERWSELAELAELPDIIRLQRSALASDALAKIAMRDLRGAESEDARQAVAARFGALVPSAALIRSPEGARYYAHWARTAGDSAWLVRARLQESGWYDVAAHDGQLGYIHEAFQEDGGEDHVETSVEVLNGAMAEGRYDSAIALLQSMHPTLEAIPVLARLVVATLAPEAISTLHMWKEVLGRAAADDALSNSSLAPPDSVGPVLGFLEAFQQLSIEDSAESRTRLLARVREMGVTFLMRPGALPAFRLQARASAAETRNDSDELLDLLLDLERDLSLAQGEPEEFLEFRLELIEYWSLLDESGDRRRVVRALAVVERVLETGLSVVGFEELVEYLRAAWAPFLTDADTSVGLEAIELLTSRRPDVASDLSSFALPILSRIGAHNAGRLGWAVVEAARSIATGYGLVLDVPDEEDKGSVLADRAVPAGLFIAIYSLAESAALRALRIIEVRYPQTRVEVHAETVGCPALSNVSRNADVLVIVDRAATHSATQSLLASRGLKPVEYARGKGTTSLLDAVDRALDRLIAGEVGS